MSGFRSGYCNGDHLDCDCEIGFCHEMGMGIGVLNDSDRVVLVMDSG